METKLHPILEQELVISGWEWGGKQEQGGWRCATRVISTMRSFIYRLFIGCIMVSKSHFRSFCAQQFLVELTFSALASAPLRPDRHRKGSQALGSWRVRGTAAQSPGFGGPGPGCGLSGSDGECDVATAWAQRHRLVTSWVPVVKGRGASLIWSNMDSCLDASFGSPLHAHSFCEVVHGHETVCTFFKE